MSPVRGCGGGWRLEHTALEEKLREWDLFRSEKRRDLNAVQPPKWKVAGKMEADCAPRCVLIGQEPIDTSCRRGNSR